MKPVLARYIAVAFVASIAAAALAANDRQYALADRGFLVLTIPDGWRDQAQYARPDLPPTIKFKPAAGAQFEVLITPMWPANSGIPKATPETVRQHVKEAAQSAKAQAVESEITIQAFTGPKMFGSYFSATDRAPKPGEYKFVTQGMISLAELRIAFTILSNDGPEAVVPKALEMLKTMRKAP